MKNLTSALRPASHLIEDDWFKLGGNLFRITAIHSGNGRTIINFYAIADPNKDGELTVPSDLPMKMYNQQ